MNGLDFSKLKGRIKEKGFNQGEIGCKIGLTEGTFSLKLNGSSDFKQSEMRKLIDVLEIPVDEIPSYFFTYKVQKNRTKTG